MAAYYPNRDFCVCCRSPQTSNETLINTSEPIPFEQILTTLDSCLKQFPTAMNTEIAEYAMGQTKICDNKNCKQIICIPSADQPKQYDENQKYANLLGYKYCVLSKQYYCHDCMDLVIECERCNKLVLPILPSKDTCDGCRNTLNDNHDTEKCYQCGIQFKFCLKCSDHIQKGLSKCGDCRNYYCQNCLVASSVCISCYYTTELKCVDCGDEWISENASYDLLPFVRCHECNHWICNKCNGPENHDTEPLCEACNHG